MQGLRIPIAGLVRAKLPVSIQSSVSIERKRFANSLSIVRPEWTLESKKRPKEELAEEELKIAEEELAERTSRRRTI